MVRSVSFTFPKLTLWHQAYKDKGLVILGLTKYFGHDDERALTPGEELLYLRNFKKQNRCHMVLSLLIMTQTISTMECFRFRCRF